MRVWAVWAFGVRVIEGDVFLDVDGRWVVDAFHAGRRHSQDGVSLDLDDTGQVCVGHLCGSWKQESACAATGKHQLHHLQVGSDQQDGA